MIVFDLKDTFNHVVYTYITYNKYNMYIIIL